MLQHEVLAYNEMGKCVIAVLSTYLCNVSVTVMKGYWICGYY